MHSKIQITMNYQTYEVYKFFLALEQYAFGDLNLFHNLIEQAEIKDEESLETKSNFLSTTFYPFGFEFNFGKPINCRATVPFSMMIFSCMDILGLIVKGGNYRSTKINIETFYNHVLEKPTKNEIDCLIKLFRNGVIHNYFPKNSQSISYSKQFPTLFFKDNTRMCLNVKILEEHFAEGFAKIKSDESLYIRMEANFNKLNKNYRQERCNFN